MNPVLAGAEEEDAVFVSDIHLVADMPELLHAFGGFLQTLAPAGVRSLFVLGDLFDAWPGDDALTDPFPSAVASMLRQLIDQGLGLYFMAGNRDFLLGEGFAAASGVSFLPDPTALRAGGVALLLSHGDLLCIDDHAYQAFREEVRGVSWQARFLAQPLEQRKRMVAGLRAASESAKAQKSDHLMDVNPEAVSAVLERYAGTILLHGHTHRPARHQVQINATLRERWVLPDWDLAATPARGGGVLARDGELFTLSLAGVSRENAALGGG